MIKQLVTLIMISVVSAACTKSGSNASGSWTLLQPGNRTTNFVVTNTERYREHGFSVVAAMEENNEATIRMWFGQWPQISQEYTVVDFWRDRQLDSDEMAITVEIPAGTYRSTGLKYMGFNEDRAEKVKVTVSGDKISFVIPSMSGHSDGPGIDSSIFHGSFNEQ